jgi:ribosomal protein L33
MDITLVCQDCHNEFIWTEDDQRFYAGKGLDKPKFCLICRGRYRAMDKDPGKTAKQK